MEYIILRTGENDNEIQNYSELTMNYESEEMKRCHYVGFSRCSTAYSSARCNNILHGTNMLDAFSKTNEADEVMSLYPKANYSFIPVIKTGPHKYFDQYDVKSDKLDVYLNDVVKVNDEYFKADTLIFEFGDFNEKQEEVFNKMKTKIEIAFSKSVFLKKIIILLDYEHVFNKKTFFL